LRYVVDAQDPIKRPHTADVGTPDPPLSWDGDDQKKEALISLIFIHRVVGRYLPCAILFRLLAVASNFACGTEPLRILKTLLDANIVPIQDPNRFRQRFNRYLKTWCKVSGNWSFWMSPYGLRRTLPREFLQRGLYGITLQLYRGHKSEQVSQVDWQFYLDRMEADPAGIYAMFQRDVVGPLNRLFEVYQTPWSASEGNVVQLFG
jgi:hypothetical protein